jgi:hypothetical protein
MLNETTTRPKHRRTRHLVACGLFEGLGTFGDLEARGLLVGGTRI